MREVGILLSNCTWASRSTISIVTGKSPGHLSFNKDMIMQIAIDMNWSEMLRKKGKFAEKTTNWKMSNEINISAK